MVDYSVPPPVWYLPPHPPSARKGRSGIFTPQNLSYILMGSFIVFAIYIYNNQDEDIYDYWKQVEQGNVPLDDDDDDLDDDDDHDDSD